MIRVLIADDELYFRNYMLTAVDWHSLGFQVCCLAQNGEEVLFELSKNTINIVFLDINMPHINGLTLAEKIKEEYPHIMIVFITGYSDFSFTRKAIQLQVEDYMLKPISPDELSELLQTLKQKYKQKQQETIRKKKLHDFTLDNYMYSLLSFSKEPSESDDGAKYLFDQWKVSDIYQIAIVEFNYISCQDLNNLNLSLLKFSVNTPIEDARKVMASVRHRYFPILDENGKYCGVVSRRNLLNLHRKQLILVDHNERQQAVDGLEEADILEIIDHHRIGNLETTGPVYFRNVPVGCTATILYQMFGEQGMTPSKEIAGLLLSAILSDTLMFRSPTSTPQDEAAAKALAALAGEDIPTYAEQMFEAGADLTGRDAEDVFCSDFKVFSRGDAKFGVGQSIYMTDKSRAAAEALVGPFLPEASRREGLPMIFYMFTDMKTQSTDLMYCGNAAEQIVREAFHVEPKDGKAWLPGVVSRKKQLIPPLLAALQAHQE